MKSYARPLSWHWLFGFLLMSDAAQCCVWDASEHELKRRFLSELRHLSTAKQVRVGELQFTENGIEAAAPEQLALLEEVARRVVSVRKRQKEAAP